MVDGGVGRKPPFTIYGDRSGRVWAGFFDGTLVVCDGDQARAFGERDGFVGGMVTSFREDGNGTLWIGSSKGLSRYRHGRFDQVTWANGLPGNVIGAIAPDGLGNLWLGSSAGILRVELAELEKGFANPSHQVRHVLYDTSDGLRGDPIGFGTPTVAESRHGLLWFVTSDGVASMDIHRVAKKRLPPPVRIERVLADTHNIPPTATGPLPPRTGHLQINYAGLSLRAPEKVRFQYLMEGFDQRWVDAGTRREAFYTNLPPGCVPLPRQGRQRRRGERIGGRLGFPDRARVPPDALVPAVARRGRGGHRHGSVADEGRAGAQQVLADSRGADAHGA